MVGGNGENECGSGTGWISREARSNGQQWPSLHRVANAGLVGIVLYMPGEDENLDALLHCSVHGGMTQVEFRHQKKIFYGIRTGEKETKRNERSLGSHSLPRPVSPLTTVPINSSQCLTLVLHAVVHRRSLLSAEEALW